MTVRIGLSGSRQKYRVGRNAGICPTFTHQLRPCDRLIRRTLGLVRVSGRTADVLSRAVRHCRFREDRTGETTRGRLDSIATGAGRLDLGFRVAPARLCIGRAGAWRSAPRDRPNSLHRACDGGRRPAPAAGFDERLVAAGLLHDAVERGQSSEAELRTEMDDDICALVMAPPRTLRSSLSGGVRERSGSRCGPAELER